MGFLDRLFKGSEQRSSDPSRGWLSSTITSNLSGANVSGEAALSLSTVYACIGKISSTVAAVDKNVYKRLKKGKDLQQGHPLAILLNENADFQTTSYNFWESVISDSLLYGKGFGYIERSKSGDPIGLVYMPAPQVKQFTNPKGLKRFAFSPAPQDGADHVKRLEISNEDVICIPAFRGLAPIELHRQNLGLAKSAENYGASFFGSGGHLSGVLKVDKSLTDEQYQALKNQWNMTYHGPQANHATAILEHGIEYEKFGIPPDQAQFIETRKMQSQEIARIFGVPASIVGLESNLNYNSVEQQAIFFSTFTLAPVVKKIENELNTKLLKPQDAGRYFIDFDMSSMMRGDAATRSSYLSTLIRDGVMTINEARAVEGLNPVTGGDINLIQSNLLPLDKAEEFGEKLVKPVEAPQGDSEADSEGDIPKEKEDGSEGPENDN